MLGGAGPCREGGQAGNAAPTRGTLSLQQWEGPEARPELQTPPRIVRLLIEALLRSEAEHLRLQRGAINVGGRVITLRDPSASWAP